MGRLIFSSFSGRIGLEYLNDLTLEQIQAKVRALPEDDLVLFGSLLKDAGGREFYTNEALSAISAASRRPVFGLLTEDLGDGILGGVLIPGYARHKPTLSVKAYVDRVVAGDLYDATLSFQLRPGFRLRGLLDNSIEDSASDNWSTPIEWVNPEYRAG